jgi:hypothetical protein
LAKNLEVILRLPLISRVVKRRSLKRKIYCWRQSFFEEEIIKAIRESYTEGALEPNNFSFMFYQKF